jgi:hypothetical protein
MMVIIEFHSVSEGVILHHKLCGDVCVKHAEACPCNVFVGQEVILVSKKCCIAHLESGEGCPMWVNCHGSGVNGNNKQGTFYNKVRGGVHCKAQPSMDGALGAK